MTLTALTADKKPYNPSAQIEAYPDLRSSIVRQMRTLSEQGLYCPHCYQRLGELIPVRFRNREDRRPHFFHVSGHNSTKKCGSYRKESDLHLNAKTSIAESLKRINQTKAEVLLEEILRDGEIKRKPDILVKYVVGTAEAHEIQISPINSSELEARTNDLKALGCNVVVWYLYGGSWNTENREWLRGNGIQCYHLFVYQEEIRWKLDEVRHEEEVEKKSPSYSRDSCNYDPEESYTEEIEDEPKYQDPEEEVEDIPPPYIDPVFYPGRIVRYGARILTVCSCDGRNLILTANQGPYQWKYGPSPEDWNFQQTTVNNLFLSAL